jgi:hypothetical protein
VEHLILGNGVAAVADHFADKNVLIGIQPALDDRHDILRVDRNIALVFHLCSPPNKIGYSLREAGMPPRCKALYHGQKEKASKF